MININAETLVNDEWEKRYLSLKEKHKNLSIQFENYMKKNRRTECEVRRDVKLEYENTFKRYKELLSEKDKEIRKLKRKIKTIKSETFKELLQMIDEGKLGLIEER